MLRKIVSVGILIFLGVVIIGIILLAWPKFWNTQAQIQGVTFSWPHARGIGLDWQETYIAILDDLGVKHMRLPVYWDELEPSKDQYNFTAWDWLLDEAEEREAEIVMVVGRKVPRWPECHVPEWAAELSEAEQQAQVLRSIEEVVRRYENHPAVITWQVENEPMLDFGNCPPFDRNFYEQELALVRSLSTKPIMVTDSGELNWWWDVSQYGDVIGTTMYRTVYSQRTGKLFHYDYLFPAWLYRAKARIVEILRDKEVVIAELQGEPWAQVSFTEITDEERAQNLSVERLKEIHSFAQRTQLPAAYWWGVEFWYWEKEIRGNSKYWETAKNFWGTM